MGTSCEVQVYTRSALITCCMYVRVVFTIFTIFMISLLANCGSCECEKSWVAWIGTIRACRSSSLSPSVCGCSGGQLKRYYLRLPSLPFPRRLCPPNTTPPLQTSSVDTTALVGRSVKAPSVSSSKVRSSSSLSLSRPFPQPKPFFSRQGRTFSTHKPSPSNSSVKIHFGARSRLRPAA